MKEYLLNILDSEKSIVEELLRIDNRIQFTDYTYEYIYNKIYNFNKFDNKLNDKYIVITDGEIDTILYILFNYIDNTIVLNINHKTIGLYKWLISRINEYYNKNIILDINNNYELYDKYDNILIAGFIEFVEGTSLLYENKNIVKIEI